MIRFCKTVSLILDQAWDDILGTSKTRLARSGWFIMAAWLPWWKTHADSAAWRLAASKNPLLVCLLDQLVDISFLTYKAFFSSLRWCRVLLRHGVLGGESLVEKRMRQVEVWKILVSEDR